MYPIARSVILYIAATLDGYIAKSDDDIGFLSMVDTPGEDFGHTEFLNTVDTVIWGRRTFEKVLSFGGEVPYRDKKVYVASRSQTGAKRHVEYTADVVGLVRSLKSEDGKDIYCDGGAGVVHELLNARLVDRLAINVIPHLLGSGIRLFADEGVEQKLRYKRSVSFPSGLVQLWYDVDREPHAV